MIHCGPFQPDPFCNSVILYSWMPLDKRISRLFYDLLTMNSSTVITPNWVKAEIGRIVAGDQRCRQRSHNNLRAPRRRARTSISPKYAKRRSFKEKIFQKRKKPKRIFS